MTKTKGDFLLWVVYFQIREGFRKRFNLAWIVVQVVWGFSRGLEFEETVNSENLGILPYEGDEIAWWRREVD